MNDVLLKYVGKKPFAIDSIGGTGVVWNGNGDIQPVPEETAEKLLKHPDQWARAPKAVAESAGKKPAATKKAADKVKAEQEVADKTEAEQEVADKTEATGTDEDGFAA